MKKQIGGDHYAKMAIQPWEYAEQNDLSFLQGSVVKYVSRYKDKGGIQDLKKAIHCIELMISIFPQESIDRVSYNLKEK